MKRKVRVENGERVVFTSEGDWGSSTWTEIGPGEIVERTISHKTREDRRLHRERLERLSLLALAWCHDEEQAGLIALDLTQHRGKGQALRSDSMQFLKANLRELAPGAGRSVRKAQKLLAEVGIRLGRSAVGALLA